MTPSGKYFSVSCFSSLKISTKVQALERHVHEHGPDGAKITFRTLGFKAFPYSMPKDTVVNVAAAKVHSCL